MWNMSSKQVAEENTCYWWTNNSFQRTGNQSTICRRLLPFFCFFPAVPGQFCILHFAYINTAYAAVVKLQFITIGGSCNYRPSQYKHRHKHKYKYKHRHKYKYKIQQPPVAHVGVENHISAFSCFPNWGTGVCLTVLKLVLKYINLLVGAPAFEQC